MCLKRSCGPGEKFVRAANALLDQVIIWEQVCLSFSSHPAMAAHLVGDVTFFPEPCVFP